MLVVSDATPVNTLIRAGRIEVLADLFGQVLIPPAVAEELSRPATPAEVRTWMAQRPAWLRIEPPTQPDEGRLRNRGEREAIALAIERRATLLLLDDRRARNVAERAGLRCVGTLGILEAGAAKGLFQLRDAFASLPMEFLSRVEPAILQESLKRDEARRKETGG